MNRIIIPTPWAMALGLAIGLATKNWAVGLALTMAFTFVNYRKKTGQKTKC
jgi:uncharacterized membrane protein YphA (DoxX/SURF4 family)